MSAADTPQQTLHTLYSEHHGWLKEWLRGRLGCAADAADLTQDAFLRLIVAPPPERLREPRHFLITIARGLVVDLFRRRTLERQYLDALAALPAPAWPSEEERALIVETLMALDAMLAGLGGKVRQVFILSQFEGLAYADIAARLGLSLRTVNNHMAKAVEHCCLFRLRQQP